MLNKDLIKKNFKKSLTTYGDNAKVQLGAAQKLFSLIEKKKYSDILEIGSYTGFLTKLIAQNLEFDSYLALDIIDSYEYIKDLSPKIKFQVSDIEKTQLNQKFDLICASSSLQWCNDFENTIEKLKNLLNKKGTIAIALYGENNFPEIKRAFKTGLNYKTTNELKKIFNGAKIVEDRIELKFENSFEILKHLKLTGVNSIDNLGFSISKIKQGMLELEKMGNKLTYNPVYIIFSNN